MKHIVRTIAIIALVAIPGSVPGSAQDQQAGRHQLGDHFLELDGVKVGFLHSVNGGEISGDLISETAGASYFVKKHIGPPKYGEFATQIDLAMKPDIYQWIEASWKQNYARKNGAIHQLNSNFESVSKTEFFNALLTGTTIPALDSQSSDAARMTIKFSPEYTRFTGSPQGGASIHGKYESDRNWVASNFKLSIEGLDCSKVNRIDSFTVKLPLPSDGIGDPRDTIDEPSRINFPNLKVTLPEGAAQDFKGWFEDFVVQGKNDEAHEKNGTLEFLAPDLKTVLARILFFNLGILKLVQDEVSAKSCDCDLCQTVVDGANSAVRHHHLSAHLYCERMDFHWVAPPDGK